MNYADEWRLLSARIRALTNAGALHAQFLAVRSDDTYGRAMRLREQCQTLQETLQGFLERFRSALPPTAMTCLTDFFGKFDNLATDTSGSKESRQERVWAALVVLSTFESEMTFLLSDIQHAIRARSELAFTHLRRSIVADPECQKRWQGAFNQGEVACEKLGAVHLLQHGIFAFKVDGLKARTDLVFNEPLVDLSGDARYADGIVLTEWKKSGPSDDPIKRFAEAVAQAKEYAAGPLAGSELRAYRFAVVVSEQQVALPPDRSEDGVLYRHINIPVKPKSPSQVSKRGVASKQATP